ncbi:MAG: hypothetical protein AAFU71_08765 [Cyanobacteria bacterium J06632_22]
MRWVVSGVLATVLVIAAQVLTVQFGWQGAVQAQPAVVLRRIEPVEIATQVYTQHPDLPLENGYFNADGTPATDSTLVSRLIRYHLFVKDRPANFRLDWKLTLADYLGAFQPMDAQFYPQQDDLQAAGGLMASDQTAVANMSRDQRNRLAQSLFEIFTGQSATP